MEFPADLKYTRDHEWLAQAGNKEAKVGVTAYAIEQLGDVVHLDLPGVGETFNAGDSFGTIESTKTVSDLYMPVKAKILAVNSDLVKAPEKLQEQPYANGWLVKIQVEGDSSQLMSASAYEKFIAEQEH